MKWLRYLRRSRLTGIFRQVLDLPTPKTNAVLDFPHVSMRDNDNGILGRSLTGQRGAALSKNTDKADIFWHVAYKFILI